MVVATVVDVELFVVVVIVVVATVVDVELLAVVTAAVDTAKELEVEPDAVKDFLI